MAGELETAKMYRDLAVKTRKMAEGSMPPEHKKSLLSIADSYERLAESTEALARKSRI